MSGLKVNIQWLWNNTKEYIHELELLTFFDIVTALASVLSVLVVRKVIDGASAHFYPGLWMILFVIITIFSLLVSALFSTVSTIVCEKYSFSLRQNLYNGILHTCMQQIADYHSGKLMTRLTSDINIIAGGVTQIFTSVFVLSAKLLAAFFTLYFFDSKLALTVIFLAPVTVVIGYVIGKKTKLIQEHVQKSEEKYRGFMQESVSNINVVKSFCMEEKFSTRLMKLRNERLQWIRKMNRMNVSASLLMNGFYNMVYIIVFVIGIMKLSNREISYGTFALFITLVNQIQDPVIGLSRLYPQAVSVYTSIGRVVEIDRLDKEVAQDDFTEPEKISISADNIHFSYGEKKILDNTSFSIGSGSFVAVLGKSGAGKTTLIKMFMSFLEPDKGNIWITDEKGEMRPISCQSRNYIAYVPQGNTLFSGTIFENVRMGKMEASDDDIKEALKCACADDFLILNDSGIQKMVGEHGHGLSEGQAQRIAIARAIVKKAPFLILDEATSALDELTEKRVLDNISRLTPKPICMIITHRKAALNYCDAMIKINPIQTI